MRKYCSNNRYLPFDFNLFIFINNGHYIFYVFASLLSSKMLTS